MTTPSTSSQTQSEYIVFQLYFFFRYAGFAFLRAILYYVILFPCFLFPYIVRK